MLLEFHKSKYNKRLVVALDETNVWMKMHLNQFTSQVKGSSSERNKPLWNLLGATLTNLSLAHAILIAGTHIGINSENTLVSALVKPARETGRSLKTISNFPLNSKEDTKLLMSRIFNEEAFSPHLWEAISTLTSGRSRYITNFAGLLEGNLAEDPEKLYYQYLQEIKTSNEKWSIYSQLSLFEKEFKVHGLKRLLELVSVSLLQERFKMEVGEEIDWLTYGICYASKDEENQNTYRLDESIVIDAIIQYLKSKNMLIPHHLVKLLNNSVDPQIFGRIFDYLIATSFWNLSGQAMSNCQFLKEVPFMKEVIPELNWPKFEFYRKGRFEDILHSTGKASFVYVPEETLGPDIIVVVRQPITFMIIVGCKTTQKQDDNGHQKNVESKIVEDNRYKLYFENWLLKFNKDTGKYEERDLQRKAKILEALGNLLKDVKGVIHIRIALPDGAKIHMAGRIESYMHTLNEQSFNEATIDLNISALSLSSIVDELTAKALQSSFQKRKFKWHVVTEREMIYWFQMEFFKAKTTDNKTEIEKDKELESFDTTIVKKDNTPGKRRSSSLKEKKKNKKQKVAEKLSE